MPTPMPDARAINEALRRAREMQNRAAHAPDPESISAPEPPPVQEAQPAPVSAAKSAPSPLDLLLQDKERALILALLILLSGENCGAELLFALMYLII